ncbi:MAG TPA: CHAT domain-containing tetratricopeptide repeat protein, partial [Vicinamibacterales bacterium]|nr:CHAT domain-containing tetratricopeptide repeat protein [Vicinamibacterales bacterium]
GFAESLRMIRELLDRGRGIEAENVSRALLARVEAATGPDALEVAEVLDLLGRAIRRSSKVANEEKSALAERAVAIKEQRLGSAHPALTVSLVNLGVQRALAGSPASATPLLERALAIQEAAAGADHPSVAAVLQTLGGLLIALRDDAGAKARLERAQRIREAAYGAGDPATLRTLVNLAILHQETGDYAGARERYRRARMLAGTMRLSADLLTLHVLSGTAVVLSDLAGDPAGAASLNERLLAFTEDAFGASDPRVRTALDNLATDLRDLGDYAGARALAERSLAIGERALGPGHLDVARSLHALAAILAASGDYAEATRLFERATRINEEVLRPSNLPSARASWLIPDLLPLSGYGPDDLDLFERVLANREKQRGPADPRLAEGMSNLAALLSGADDFRRSLPMFERALESQERFLGPDHPEVAAAATNLARVRAGMGDLQKATALYQRALTIWEGALGPRHPRVATALVNLARVHVRAGAARDAGPLLDRALAIQIAALGPDHPDTAVTLSSLAEVSARTGAAVDAFALAAQADAVNREHLRLTLRALPERQALAYAASRGADLQLMLRVASARADDSPIVTAGWDAVIQARGMVLDEVAARHRASGALEAEAVTALAAELAAARQRLATLAVRGVRNDAPASYRRLLEDARGEKDRTERALAETSAAFRDGEVSRRVALPQVSAALPSGSALVAFVKYQGDPDPSYLAFVLRGAGARPVLVPLGTEATIDRLIQQVRRQINEEAIAPLAVAGRSEGAYRRMAGELRAAIWDPLRRHLGGATRVFVVPDGALHLVSFAALPEGLSQYMVETGPVIHYLSAERDLVPLQRGPTGARGLLALGGAAFDDIGSGRAAAPSFRGTRSTCLDFQSLRFDALPASIKEVDDVVSVWDRAHGARDTLRLTGAAATEAAFKQTAGGRRILHLATHGYFLDRNCAPAPDPRAAPAPAVSPSRIARENPLLLSGLILAGANRRGAAAPDDEDGVLTAEEVAALNLDGVEWAVLSGCDTGVGEIRSGEGVFGLRRAFQIAGVRAVIMTLWPVEDETTRRWMTSLYEGRWSRQLSTADAVRAASLAVLRQRRSSGRSAHPFYWAAFVAAGDWR